jgi:Beta-lactamase enzyme family
LIASSDPPLGAYRGAVRAALLIASLLAGAPPAGWTPDVDAAAAYAERRAGNVSFHVRTERGLWSHDADRSFASASVVKAMLMAAYLNRPEVRQRALRAADRRLLDPMIRRSDNAAASRVRDIVGNDALARLAARAGMTRFATNPVWGLTRITARDQTRLWLRFESFVARRHRQTALQLLSSIVPRQRWGFGRLRLPPGWQLHFKGGWGSGRGLVDHQVALLRRGDERVAIAILTSGSPSHAYAKQTLRGVAERLLKRLP